ncbi:MAG TPA: hypothetical protein VGJ80_04120 [Gemmatimonadales bacterium]
MTRRTNATIAGITYLLSLALAFPSMATQLMWIPVAVFELVVAMWLIVKGAAVPAARMNA